ncbi:MAG: TMEM143 family protein [Filomicrobium sp.]
MSPAQSANTIETVPANLADEASASITQAKTKETAAPRTSKDGHRVPASVTIEVVKDGEEQDVLAPDDKRDLEHFIPITRFALMDRLTLPSAWPPGQAAQARRFFNYIDYWRHQRYSAKMLELEQTYEPFSPDSDLLMTRSFTDEELGQMQKRMVDGVRELLVQANYRPIPPEDVAKIMADESHYGLDLHVDFDLFEECLIYYRGASTRKDQKRTLRKFMRKEEFEVPIFQRLFLLFKLKPLERRVREIMESEKVSAKEAERMAKKQRAHLPAAVVPGNIYMKLFKNIPRSDVEMIFPNTVVKYRLLDKIKLGGGSAVGVGSSIVVAAGKAGAALTNPIAAVMVVGGLGAAVFRQAMNFVNTKQRYMVIMAQNLYFHSLADNRGVMIILTDRAAEEDVKEEMLLYSVLAKERANRRDLKNIDIAIEQYLKTSFGIDVDFDLDDALERLLADGVVTEDANGDLHTLAPEAASKHIDDMWDILLDNLPDYDPHEGVEMEVDKLRADNGLHQQAANT